MLLGGYPMDCVQVGDVKVVKYLVAGIGKTPGGNARLFTAGGVIDCNVSPEEASKLLHFITYEEREAERKREDEVRAVKVKIHKEREETCRTALEEIVDRNDEISEQLLREIGKRHFVESDPLAAYGHAEGILRELGYCVWQARDSNPPGPGISWIPGDEYKKRWEAYRTRQEARQSKRAAPKKAQKRGKK